MTNMVDCWRYPGTDEPSGFCAFKAVCPNKQSFKMAIQKEATGALYISNFNERSIIKTQITHVRSGEID